MAQNPSQTTLADSNLAAVFHTAVEMGECAFPALATDELFHFSSAASNDIVYPPRSGEPLSGTASDFFDGSYALYALYNENTTEFDRELINNWLEHVRDLMVLVRQTLFVRVVPQC